MNLDTALLARAFDHVTHTPARSAAAFRRGYDKACADLRDAYGEAAEPVLAEYTKHINAYLEAMSRTVSAHVAGPANFRPSKANPDKHMAAALDALDRGRRELRKANRKKAMSDPEHLRSELATWEALSAGMKAVNAAVRKGTPFLEECARQGGMVAKLADNYRGYGKFPPHALANAREPINMLKQRLEKLEAGR